MITSLRKRHFRIWLLFIPILIFALFLSVSNRIQSAQQISEASENSLGLVILEEFQNEYLKVNFKGENGKVSLMEIALIQPLKAASAELKFKTEQSEFTFLSKIGSQRVYYFEISPSQTVPSHLLIWDFIKQKEITNLKLE